MSPKKMKRKKQKDSKRAMPKKAQVAGERHSEEKKAPITKKRVSSAPPESPERPQEHALGILFADDELDLAQFLRRL